MAGKFIVEDRDFTLSPSFISSGDLKNLSPFPSIEYKSKVEENSENLAGNNSPPTDSQIIQNSPFIAVPTQVTLLVTKDNQFFSIPKNCHQKVKYKIRHLYL